MKGLPNDHHIPLNYYYEVSTDGQNWKRVTEISNNKRWEIMDKWSVITQTRFVKIVVASTQKGSFLSLEEAEPILEEAKDIFKTYSTWSQLKKDAIDIYNLTNNQQFQTLRNMGINTVWGKFIWKTNFKNSVEQYYFPIVIDSNYHTYRIPIYESEWNSGPGQFLKRKIETVGLELDDFPGRVFLKEIRLQPKVELDDD